MLKFIKGHVASIDGIDIFPVLSFIIFFSIFIAALIMVIMMKKSKVEHMANLPLEGSSSINND